MGQDKRERQRLKRARKKASAARHSTRLDEQSARRDRAIRAAMAAEHLLSADNATGALSAAAQAVELWPRDRAIAALYVEAAERARDTGARIRACEHLLQLVGPDATLLIGLADCHAARGDGAAARGAARARRVACPHGRPTWAARGSISNSATG